MNERRIYKGARYGVDIRGHSVHAEADELAQVLAALNGHAGIARVTDRLSQNVAFDGTVDEVRQSISAFSAQREQLLCEIMDGSGNPRV